MATVWRRFRLSGFDFVVESLGERYHEHVLAKFAPLYCQDEPRRRSYDFVNDPVSLEEMRTFWRSLFGGNLCLACRVEGTDSIVAVCMSALQVKGQPSPASLTSPTGEASKRWSTTVAYPSSLIDLYERHGIDRYVNGYGLVLDRQHRGKGIAKEILKARVPLAQQHRVPLIVEQCTSLRSQMLCAHLGFQTELEISYEELARKGYGCPGIQERSLKIMTQTIEPNTVE